MASNLPNSSDIRVAVNEYLTRYSFNRNIEKLLENDKYLADLYLSTLKTLNTLQYVEGTTYNYNDVVWYTDLNTGKLYILKCIELDNILTPDPEDFMKSGWADQQENIDIFKYNVKNWLYQLINEQFAVHENNTNYHKFGNTEEYEKKILLNDMSNIRSDRKTNFFPYLTGILSPSGCIVNGTYKVWDCGLLEFDIIYRMHLSELVVINNMSCDVIKANDLQLTNGHMRSATAGNYNENDNYFNASDNYNMFKLDDNSISVLVGNLLNVNLNDHVNAFYADISFPAIAFNGHAITGFKDINYMIFNGDILANANYNGVMKPNRNSMTYVNKNNYSFTALYLMSGKDVGLNANTFHCQVVGRWK